jgi:hypothetical protein
MLECWDLIKKTDEKVSEPKVADVATIEVSPKDAEKIALIADWNSTISLVLRSLSDSGDTSAVTRNATASEVVPDVTAGISLDKAEAALPETVKPHTYTWDSDVSKVLPRPRFRYQRLAPCSGHPWQGQCRG